MTVPPVPCRLRPPRPDLLALALVCCLATAAHATAPLALDPSIDPSVDAEDAEWAQDGVYLEVVVNEVRQSTLHRFMVIDGRLFATPPTLRNLGLRVEADIAGNRLLPLEREGVAVAYDVGAQRVAITAALSELTLATTRLEARTRAATPSPSPLGALFNYDLQAMRSGGHGNAVLSPYVRLFGLGAATLETNGILQARSGDHGWQTRAVRLDSRIRWTLPERALEVILGDLTTDGPDWARQMRMGGIRVGTNYASLQPYRMLSPGPVFEGENAVPSNVELYVNGIKQYEAQAPVGPFVVSGAPSMEGLGNARLVVTDAYGRMRSIDVPFYGSQRLLAPGLSDWSAALGRVRLEYGAESSRYAPDAALDASWRRGMGARFTGELHAQATRGLRMGGAGGAWLLGRAGVVHAAWAASSAGALEGSKHAWGYQWSNGRLSASLDSTRTHGDFRDLAAVTSGFLPARATDSINLGASSPLLGNFNVTYANLHYPQQSRTRLAGLYWSRAMAGRWFVNLGGNADLDNRTQRSITLGVTMLLGEQRHASASVQHTPDRTYAETDLRKQARVNGDVGWRLQARHDSTGSAGGLAEATWLTPAAELGAGMARYGSQTQFHAMARGGVVWMGRSLFHSREVVSGFALVDTGHAGVPVLLENRPYGVTNRAGQLIVTPVFPFQRNRISIDPTGLPADIRVPQRDKDAVPGASGAARISFELAAVRAALVVLHDRDGKVLEMGSQVHRRGAPDTGEDTIVGYDGEVYLEGLSATNVLDVTTPAGRCAARFDYTARDADIPRIGPVACIPEPAR